MFGLPARPALLTQVATSNASARWHIPRTFALGHLPLRDRVQILQPRRTDERLVAHIDVAGYRVVAEVDRIGERVQPVCKVALVARHFTIAVRNVSTTLIQPGSEFKLNSTASVRSILSGRLGAYLLGAAL